MPSLPLKACSIVSPANAFAVTINVRIKIATISLQIEYFKIENLKIEKEIEKLLLGIDHPSLKRARIFLAKRNSKGR
jgi:hypothetical protein